MTTLKASSVAVGAAPEGLSPTGLAEDIRRARERAAAAELEVLELAVAWADAHPDLDDDGRPVSPQRVDDHALAAHFVGIDPEEPVDSPAWAGLPGVAWHAGAGFALACGISTPAGRALLRDALVLRHRLPRTWRRVGAGEVPAWRARLIAQEVAGAPADVCAAVDDLIAPRADRIGTTALRRLTGELMIRLYPDEVEAASLEQLERRYVRLDREHVGHTGVTGMEIRGDYADLDDFDQVLTELAERLAATDPTAAAVSLDVRRARAVGVLSDPGRAQAMLDAAASDTDSETDTDADPDRAAESGDSAGLVDRRPVPGRRRRTMLVLQISDLALLGLDPAAEDLGGQRAVLADRVAAWCGRDRADLTVLPVLDSDAHRAADGYAAPAGLRRHLGVRDGHCLFPWCHREAAACDCDHVVPHGRGGGTCSCNLVPLCRHHHRLKTHAGYAPTLVEPGVVWWHTPYGHEFVVSRDGTLPVHRAPPRSTCLAA
jgi:hypothetical protein